MAMTHLGSNNKELNFGCFTNYELRYSQNFKGLSLVILGYHWLSLATIHIVGGDKEFESGGVFWDA